jgi:nucleotide-binding universal stress UspA family protein
MMYTRILVPIDGSRPSKLALQEAIKIAKGSEATMQLLHVVDEYLVGPALDASYMSSSIYADALGAIQASGHRTLEEAQKIVSEAGVEPQLTFVETVGRRPSDIIVEKAAEWGADLIVMGTHGRRGLRRLVMGSDAEGVLRSTTIPVLLVRGPED